MKPKLSAVIITLNEEQDLPRCLKSLGFVDEIVVVDSGSSDKTVEIAKKYGAKVFKHKFDNYASQKNFAANKATGDWLFSIDADEEVPSELAREMLSASSDKQSTISAYSMPRKNIIFGKFIRYTRWQPELDRQVWLWKKGFGRWTGKVHEQLQIEGETAKLKQGKIHYQVKNVAAFIKKLNRYSELEADKKINNGESFSIIKLLMMPVYNFLVRYFYRLGFLDGLHGFVLSYLMAFYHFQVWAKIWEKSQ